MKNNEFKQFLTQAKLLTPLQATTVASGAKRTCFGSYEQAARQGERARTTIERNAGMRSLRCVGSPQAWQVERSGSVSLPCGGFAARPGPALTGTKLAGLRKRDKWETYEQCLRDRLTLAESAKRCEINVKTAFKWRHRMVSEARPTPELAGVVEIDETYFHESEKGKRDLIERRKPRKRGGNPDGDAIQRPVMTTVARGGETVAWETYDMTSTPVQVMMKATTRPRLRGGHRQPSNLSVGGAELESNSPGAQSEQRRTKSRDLASQYRQQSTLGDEKQIESLPSRSVDQVFGQLHELACTPGIQARQVCGT